MPDIWGEIGGVLAGWMARGGYGDGENNRKIWQHFKDG